MSSSFIIFALVLVAGWMITAARRPPWLLQPAMAVAPNGLVSNIRRRVVGAERLVAAVGIDHDDDNNIIIDTLRVLGLVRKRVDRPMTGRKAYVRWWERLRALIVLGAIVVSLGIALAVLVGITVLGFGFLLEQAIS